jgi:hypothetical protein
LFSYYAQYLGICLCAHLSAYGCPLAIVPFNRKNYLILSAAYSAAVANNQETFTVVLDTVSREFLTSYAKYVLEYLKPHLGRPSDNF